MPLIILTCRDLTVRKKRESPQTFLSTSIIYAFIAIIFALKSAFAGEYVSPPTIEGVKTVSAPQVIELLGRLPNLVIVDSRTDKDHNRGFIQGSIHLKDTQTNCATLAKIIPDLKTPAIFYCNGDKCRRSDQAVKIALSCHYNAIYWFRGGIEEWVQNKYPLITG